MGLINQILNKIGNGAAANPLNQQKVEPGKELPMTDDKEPGISQQIFKDELIKLVKSEYDRRKTERIPFELQWQLNINFLGGNQYCDISLETRSVVEIPKLYWYSEREPYNHIAPIYETRLAKLGKVDPSLKARPSTNSRQDISSAKICTALLKGTYSEKKMLEKIKYANAWAEQTGTVFHKPVWDIRKGKILGVLNDEEIREGDINQSVVPSFEIFPDSPFSEGIEGCRSLIHARAMHVDDIFEQWGQEVKGREVDVFNMSQTSIGCGGLGYTANVQKVTPAKKKNHEVVLEYYERPSRKFRNGRLIIIAGTTLLYYGELPYMIGDDNERGIPFVRQVCIDRPGYFWGISVIERLIPIQRSYNAVKNRKHEYINRCTIGVLTYVDGSIDIETIESDGIPPGSHIPYMDGKQPPRFLENGGLPPEFENEEAKLENLFTVISGVSSFARESTPPVGANSGVAMEIVKEQDDNRLSLTAENIRLAVIRVGIMWLRLYKQFAQGPRVLKYVGSNNDVQVMDWQSTDITTFDVVIESENELAQTPAQRKQMVFDLLNAGLFNDPDTGHISRAVRSKILEMVELGNWESGDSVDVEHINRAMRENMFLEKGQVPHIFEFDDDGLHMNEHIKYMLTTDFEQLAATNPQMANMMYMHLKQHEASLAFKAGQQQGSKPPSTSISFKDLPTDGQVQLAQQANIKLNPATMALDKLMAQKPGQAPVPVGASNSVQSLQAGQNSGQQPL